MFSRINGRIILPKNHEEVLSEWTLKIVHMKVQERCEIDSFDIYRHFGIPQPDLNMIEVDDIPFVVREESIYNKNF